MAGKEFFYRSPDLGDGSGSLIQKHSLDQEQRAKSSFDEGILVNNELGRVPDIEKVIRADQAIMLEHPSRVHLRFFVGPSGIGKTTLAGQMAEINESDAQFSRELRRQTRISDYHFRVVHFSLSMALNWAAEALEKEKRDLNEDDRRLASNLLIDEILRTQASYYMRRQKNFALGLYVDVVGLTESDLGRRALQMYADQRHTRVFAIKPDDEIESKAMRIRGYLKEHANDPNFNIDEWLLSQGIHAGTIVHNREKVVNDSWGDEMAFRRHWADFIKQGLLKYPGKTAIHLKATNLRFLFEPGVNIAGLDLVNHPEFITFLKRHPGSRHSFYTEVFVPSRMRELGVDFTDEGDDVADEDKNYSAKGIWVPNTEPFDNIHTHFARFYGEDSDLNAEEEKQ